MRQAWMLPPLAIMATWAISGCGMFGDARFDWEKFGISNRKVASEPIQTPPEELVATDDQDTSQETQDAGGKEIADLKMQTGDFFRRLLADKTKKQTNSTQSPTTQPAAQQALADRTVTPRANTSAGKWINSAIKSSPPPPAPAGVSAAQRSSRKPRIELIDVRPAAMSSSPDKSQEPVVSANRPVNEDKPIAYPAELANLIEELEKAIQENPAHLDDQFRLRLLYLATGRYDKAVEPIEGADPAQADLLASLIRVLASTQKTINQPHRTTSSALDAVEELRQLLGQFSEVTIPKMALVTRVDSFGDYEAITPARFPAGQPVHVFLYTEVANFRSEPTAEGGLRTLLSEKVEVFNAETGESIWQQTAPHIEDIVLRPRRDFFIPFEIMLPADTPAGEYILKVTIEDKIGNTTNQQTLLFSIVAQ